jgi:hypothetical protein
MRKITLAAALAAGALSLAACSQETKDKAGEAMDSAAADAQANASTAGESIDSAAQAAGAAIDTAADRVGKAATDAKNAAEADLQGESKEEAAKD